MRQAAGKIRLNEPLLDPKDDLARGYLGTDIKTF
jgi:hypothetical protein